MRGGNAGKFSGGSWRRFRNIALRHVGFVGLHPVGGPFFAADFLGLCLAKFLCQAASQVALKLIWLDPFAGN
jgi:hypothetical protein